MRKIVLLFFVTIAPIIFAQEKRYDFISMEAGYGIHAVLTPGDKISRSNYVGAGSFELGFRYNLTPKFGLKLGYHNNSFKNSGNKDIGIVHNRFAISAVYNLGKDVISYRSWMYDTFGLLTHVGLGYTHAKSIDAKSSEQIANFMAGVRPQFKLNNQFALFGDLTYVFSFKQHFAYSGVLLTSDYHDKTGSFVTLNLGLMFYIGNKERHADWY